MTHQRTADTEPAATVVVLTWNSAATLGACLEALVPQLDGADATLLVVDNDSDDDSVQVANTAGARVVRAGANLGFAAGCNLGAHHATGRVLVFVNPDATLAPGTLARLVKVAATGDHGPVGATARHGDGSFDPRCTMGGPSLRGAVAFATGVDTMLRGNPVADPEYGLAMLPPDATIVPVAAVSGAVLAIEAGLFATLDGFNEDYFVYGEDVDLCLRARALGRPTVLVADADYHHVGGMAANPSLRRRTLLFRGKAQLYRDHLPPTAARVANLALRSGSLLRGAPALVAGHRVADRALPWLQLWRHRADWTAGHTATDQSQRHATTIPGAIPATDTWSAASTTTTAAGATRRPHQSWPGAPCASVIIPAHDEGTGITTTLATLLADAAPGEFEVVVVCNGCSDDTAQQARTIDGVVVEELATASKVGALRHADTVATTFPRIHLDADVRLSTAAARELVAALATDQPRVAGVVGRVDTDQSGMATRWYFDFRQRLPVFHHGIIGAGVYAMNRAGRDRFGAWPDVIGDDQFVFRLFAPTERITVPGHHTRVAAPPDLATVIRRQLRVRRGNAQLSRSDTDRDALKAPSAGVAHALTGIRTVPGAWPGAVTWAAVNLVVRFASRMPRLRGDWS